jgi:peptide/nickel transport system permease protein
MLKYLLRRLLIIVPTMFAIMSLSFMISRNTPGDIVATIASSDAADQHSSFRTREDGQREYQRVKTDLGLDGPVFYVSMKSIAYPDTMHRILRRNEKRGLQRLIARYGNWEEISNYYHAVCRLEDQAYAVPAPDSIKPDYNSLLMSLNTLRYVANDSEIDFNIEMIDSVAEKHPEILGSIATGMDSVKAALAAVKNNPTTWKLYVPTLNWYGTDNQFHHWMAAFISLDFGKSFQDHRPVSSKIGEALPWTIFMGLLSFLIAYLVAIPVGVYTVRYRDTWKDRTVTTLLFLMAAVPSFVTAMLVMTFFCNPEFLYIFPTSGVASDGAENWAFWDRMLDYAYHLILPTIVFSYGGVAFLSRQMRVGMIDNVEMDYIRTARAKGLSENVVIWKHAFRNSILPVITHFASLLPRLVSGAVILETIFAIPGVGRLAIQASFGYDHPVIIAILTITALLTLFGVLLSDILYAVADPRITFSRQ